MFSRPFVGKACAFLLALAVLPLVALAQQSSTATFTLKVPADAKIVVNGKATTSTGAERTFTTPAMRPGASQTYQVEIIWSDKGQERRSNVQIPLKAGDQINLDLSAPGGAAPAQVEPKKIEPPIKNEPKKTVEPPKKVAPPKKVEPPKIDVPKAEPKKTAAVKERSFQFTYKGLIKDQPPGKEVNVWLPVAVNTGEQQATLVGKKLPAPDKIAKEPLYGNSILFFQAKADQKGEVPFELTFNVKRKEVKTDVAGNLTVQVKEQKKLLDRFLQPDAMVPISGKPLELIKDKKLSADQYAAAKTLYDVVNDHMKYSKEGTGWGRGDSVWACDSKFGNCTDFHSLFISMARGNKIPSKFEMGFPLPPKHGEGAIGGYHCWAWFLPNGKGWVPVDISEANRNPELKNYYFGNLTEDRVVFTTGRDFNLVPQQKGPALNFFIYPYAEVDGQPVPADKMTRSFAFKDAK